MFRKKLKNINCLHKTFYNLHKSFFWKLKCHRKTTAALITVCFVCGMPNTCLQGESHLSFSLSFFFFLYSINFPKYRKYTFISCKQRGYLSQPRKETLLGCFSNKKNIRNRPIKRSKAYCGYVNHWIWIILKVYGPLMKNFSMCQSQKLWNIFKCTNPFLLKNYCLFLCFHTFWKR